jgi:hypothetical protein
MDALILRVALALCLPVSSVARLQATDVLAHAIAGARESGDEELRVDGRAIRAATLTSMAMYDGKALEQEQEHLRARLGITAPASNADAFFAAMPLTEG